MQTKTILKAIIIKLCFIIALTPALTVSTGVFQSRAQDSKLYSFNQAGQEFQPFGIVRGNSHACTLDFNLKVVCWKSNQAIDYYQLEAPEDFGEAESVVASEDFTCAISVIGKVWCDGASSSFAHFGSNWLEVPSILESLGPAKLIEAAGNRICAISGTVNLTCWGFELQPWLTKTLSKNVLQAIPFEDRACILYTDKSLSCIYESTGEEILFSEQNSGIVQIANSGQELCKLDTDGLVQCIGENQEFFTIDLEAPAKYIRVGDPSHTCAVLVTKSVACWSNQGYFWLETEFLANSREVEDIAPGADGDCLLFSDGRIECSDSVAPNVGPVYSPPTPEGIEFFRTGSLLKIQVNHKYRQSNGDLSWILRKVGSVQEICRINARTKSYCLLDGLQYGNFYQFSVTGENELGQAETWIAEPYKFCPIHKPIIEAGYFQNGQQGLRAGSLVTITGYWLNVCSTPDSSIQFRQRPTDGSWSKWVELEMAASNSFKLTKSYAVNSFVQFRGKHDSDYYYSQPVPVRVKLKTPKPISYQVRELQSNQSASGAVIRVLFSGDAGYSGYCAVSALTSRALDLEGSNRGYESRSVLFFVNSGSGFGDIRMKWDGITKVSLNCQSKQFLEVRDFRILRIK